MGPSDPWWSCGAAELLVSPASGLNPDLQALQQSVRVLSDTAVPLQRLQDCLEDTKYVPACVGQHAALRPVSVHCLDVNVRVLSTRVSGAALSTRVSGAALSTRVLLRMYAFGPHQKAVRTRKLRFFVDVICPAVMCCVRLLERVAGHRDLVDLMYVPCSERRLLPLPPGILGPEHVNGGVTFFESFFGAERFSPELRGARILVYREEDAVKVCMHELLHLYGCDANLHAPQIERQLCSTYNIELVSGGSERLGIAEAYVDTLACYFYSIQAARMLNRKVHEMMHEMNQHIQAVAKTLMVDHWGKESKKHNSFLSTRKPEKTHAFAYYICKAALWAHSLPQVLSLGFDSSSSLSPKYSGPSAAAFAACLLPALEKWFASSYSSRTSRALRMTPPAWEKATLMIKSNS